MTWETILTILASLSIPSILVSVFFYIQNRKYKKWEAKRDLELKKIEFEEEMANGDKEYVKKMAENDRGLLGSSRVANFTEAREILETSKKKLRKIGAEMEFGTKYPEIVSLYFIEDKNGNSISKEFCGGPHIDNTGVLGHFKIQKEEASSAGVRRIKAILE